MKTSLSSLALPLVFAASAAHAIDTDTLPGNLCLVSPQGIATIYHQTAEEEGIYIPALRSNAPLVDASGLLGGFLKTSWKVGELGKFTSTVTQFNRKKSEWLPQSGNIEVTAKTWSGNSVSGHCQGKGSFSIGAPIQRLEDYPSIGNGSDIVKHKDIFYNGVLLPVAKHP